MAAQLKSNDGFWRIRIIAAATSAAVFGITALGQFAGQPIGTMLLGVIVSAGLGFSILWFCMTVIGFIIGKYKRQ